MALTHCHVANNCSLLEIVNILFPCPAIKEPYFCNPYGCAVCVERKMTTEDEDLPLLSTGVLCLICLSSVWQLFVVSAGMREQVGHGPE